MKHAFPFLIACTTLALQPALAETPDSQESQPIAEAIGQPSAQSNPATIASAPPAPAPLATEPKPEFDTRKMERDLQELPWKQARSIIESVPKLKSSVDAYGPLGWQFVEANYRQYGWKKKIDKLDSSQKGQLAELIRKAQNSR